MKISLRAFLWGCGLSVFIVVLDIVTIVKIQRFGLCADPVGAGAILCLFILVVFLNPLFKRISEKLVFTPPELLSIFSMVLVSSTIPTWGLMASLVGNMAGPGYLAIPENRYASLFLPYIKPWLMVQDKQAITYFFESIPKGTPIPYSAWIIPIFSWFIFMILLYLASMFIGVIFRKQWVENEKLVFPLAVLPVEMVKGAEGGEMPVLFKNRIMWLGFATSGIVAGLQMLHSFFPFVPYLNLSPYNHYFRLLRGSTGINLGVFFTVVGFAYLLNTSVAFSLWFFNLFFTLQKGILGMRGFVLSGPNEPFAGGDAFSSFQGMGGMICLVIFIIWVARGHLSKVLKKAFVGDKNIDDSHEILSYRTSIFGLIITFLLILIWLKFSGMPWLVSFLFLIFSFIVLLTLSRIVCEGGAGFLRAQCQPMHVVAYSLPPEVVTSQGYAAMGLHYNWITGQRNNTMISAFNSFKIAETSKVKGRSLFFALLFSIILSFFVSAFIMLKVNYEWGAINCFRAWHFIDIPKFSANFGISKTLSPITSQMITQRFGATLAGVGIMAFLIFMRYRFLWWPLHPLGFPVGNAGFVTTVWFSIFLAWLIKSLIIRFGGLPLYKKSVPYFLGLILGEIITVAFWILINSLIGNTGVFPVPLGPD